MNCASCGAPLPAKSLVCTYCHRLNDVDLRAVSERVQSGATTDRVCPHCEQPLCAIQLQARETFTLDRCDLCLGIFFDLGELEVLLNQSVANVHRVDRDRLQALIDKESKVQPRPVRYIKCPVCSAHMNRRKHGSRSQVIVDSCSDHGLWLDGGELSQLLQWTKAGGQIHDDLRRREQTKAQAREERLERHLGPAIGPAGNADSLPLGRSMGGRPENTLEGLIWTALRMIF